MIFRYFTSVPAWQLFVLLLLPYLVFKLTGFGHTPTTFCILWLYFLCMLLGWLYSVAETSNSRLDESLRLNIWWMRIAVIFPLIYLVIFVYGYIAPLSKGELARPPVWIMPMHFASIFCFMFAIWFTARQFVTHRENRPVQYVEYYGAFMGFWIFPIGIWFLQKQINEQLN